MCDLDLIQEDYRTKYVEFVQTSENVKKLYIDHVPGEISISTITMIIDFNEEINLEKFNTNFKHPEDETVLWSIELSKRRKKGDDSSTKSTFYNQTTLRFKDTTQKSIKIFRNGRLQMTGIRSVMNGIDVAIRVGKCISNTEGATKKNLVIQSLKIGMINTNFSFRMGLNLQTLQRILLHQNIDTIYEPDVYPGLKVSIMPTGKVFIFGTGKVVITGAKDLTFIQDAFVKLHNIISYNWNLVKSPMHTREKEKPNKVQLQHGYKISDFEAATKKKFSTNFKCLLEE
jgi:TATA-box binding protein (TBP) (component of TFIID and TFIIIB)